ncbi:MAG: purine-binding chemotaxis protein CheW [Calditrichaeota bacterium]|nr:purine-binding chemotaxis protein CheW [Calditrichota bacterium]
MQETDNFSTRINTQVGMDNKFLTFNIGKEQYGIEIKYVTQILGMQSITSLPEMPSFIQGVINLRGKVIPVINVRVRFGFESLEFTDRTCIIVVDMDRILVGLIVDQMQEVLTIPNEKIEATPTLNKSVESRYIAGLGKSAESVIILLNTQKLLFDDELEKVVKQVKKKEKN